MNCQTAVGLYRGLMPDAVLDDPGFPAARERMWTAALTDERYRRNRAAVAVRDDELVGIAMSGPPVDAIVRRAATRPPGPYAGTAPRQGLTSPCRPGPDRSR